MSQAPSLEAGGLPPGPRTTHIPTIPRCTVRRNFLMPRIFFTHLFLPEEPQPFKRGNAFPTSRYIFCQSRDGFTLPISPDPVFPNRSTRFSLPFPSQPVVPGGIPTEITRSPRAYHTQVCFRAVTRDVLFCWT